MGLFGCKSCEYLRHERSSLLAQLSDKDEVILRLIREHSEDRKELVSQVLAATRPGAVTELRREPRARLPQSAPPRPNFPGFRRDPRPPTDTPLLGEISGGEPAPRADLEAVAALDAAIDRFNH